MPRAAFHKLVPLDLTQEDRQLERAKQDFLREIEWNEFVESTSLESRRAERQKAPALVQQGKEAAARGAFGEAVELLQKAYELQGDTQTRRVLIETHIAYTQTLLSVGEWGQAQLRLDSLQKKGLVNGAIYHLLAQAYFMAFEREGRIIVRHLREALQAIQAAIGEEPLNPSYHLESARINASYARWWKGAKDEDRFVPRYRDKAIEEMNLAYTASSGAGEVCQELRNIAATLTSAGVPMDALPPNLLAILATSPQRQQLPDS